MELIIFLDVVGEQKTSIQDIADKTEVSQGRTQYILSTNELRSCKPKFIGKLKERNFEMLVCFLFVIKGKRTKLSFSLSNLSTCEATFF